MRSRWVVSLAACLWWTGLRGTAASSKKHSHAKKKHHHAKHHHHHDGGSPPGTSTGDDVVDRLQDLVCPRAQGELRYGSHVLPKRIIYTGVRDSKLKNLTWGETGAWPDDYVFSYFDNDAVDDSMRLLSQMLETYVDGDVFEAYAALRPWAFKVDIWRYAILWACGGVYVDSKLAIAEPFETFLTRVGFNEEALAHTDHPQLLSCRADLASDSIVLDVDADKFSCIWQGLLISEPRNPSLLRTIQWVVTKIHNRWYPPVDDFEMPWLFLTGPGAMALATQLDDPDWDSHIRLNCRMTFTPKKNDYEPLMNPHLVGDWHLAPGEGNTVFDSNLNRSSFVVNALLHATQRTNDYGKLFRSHMVYMEETKHNETHAQQFRSPRRRRGHSKSRARHLAHDAPPETAEGRAPGR